MDAVHQYREILLDVSVNVIVLGMLGFFLVLIISGNPWGVTPRLIEATVIALFVIPIVGLGAVTALVAARFHGGR